MNRAVGRSLAAVVIVAVTCGGCLGSSPSSTPVDPVASLVPSRPASASTDPRPGATPRASTGAAPASAAPATSPAATGLPGSPPPPPVLGPTVGRRFRAVQSATPMLRAALHARLEVLRAKYGIPGVSVAIIFADGSVWHDEAGLADVAAGRAVTSDTAFSVASLSKTFTAALILGLVEDGRIGLEATARTYLPSLAIDPAITIRQLLDHTSGLRDFFFHPRIDKALLTRPERAWDATRSLGYVGRPYAKPGVSWHYSNTNYVVLGLIAEAVSGAPVAEQLRSRFLTPLGLDDTWYQAVEAPRGPVARGYRFTGADPKLPAIDLSDGSPVVPFTSVVTASGAAGSMASTAGDLARWARALYGGDALAPRSREAMVADILRTAQYTPSTGYGLGVQAVTVAGEATLGHSGRFLGSRAVARWLPDERIAIAITTNQSRTDPNVILRDLLSLALRSLAQWPEADCLACRKVP